LALASRLTWPILGHALRAELCSVALRSCSGLGAG